MSLTRRKLFAVAALAVALTGCRRPSPEQSFQQGLASYQAGKYAKAAEHFEQAIAHAPPTPQALTLLGVCQLHDRKADTAVRRFQEALKLDPNYTPARYNLALAYFERGRFEEAATELKLVLQKPNPPAEAKTYLAVACNNLAVTAARQRDFKRAEQHLQTALAADPKSAETARNLVSLKNLTAPPKPATPVSTNVPAAPKPVAPPEPAPTQAVAVAKVAPPSSPPPAPQPPVTSNRRIALAPRTFTPGDRAEARELFNQAVPLHQQGNLSQAIPFYEKAIATDPSFAQAYYNLAIAHRDLRHSSQAFDNYELALMADPKFTDARLNYAILLQQQGYVADALAQYESLLQSDPNNAPLHLTVAAFYARDRKTLEKARAHYEAYLRLSPVSPPRRRNPPLA